MEYRSSGFKNCISLLLALVLLLSAVWAAPANAEAVLLGDLDASGSITAEDARAALRLAVRLDPVTPFSQAVGDVDASGAVTAADARFILRVAVKLETMNGATVEVAKDPYAAMFARLPTAIPPAPAVNAPSGTFTVVTYGWGHCVGMSQYGAILMANVGLPYDYILRYYFAGTCIVYNPNYPTATYYAGTYRNTEELLCCIVSQEIGGGNTPDEALKAQAVAVFTLLRMYNFSVKYKYNVGYAARYENCSDRLKNAVHQVVGQYLALENDPQYNPVLTVYGAMCAGRTLGCAELWGGGYPVSVYSPFEASLPNFADVQVLTASQMRSKIWGWSTSVILPENPAEWLRVISHDGSLDASRGYVTELQVGNKTVKGVSSVYNFCNAFGLRSPCFTVVYNP